MTKSMSATARGKRLAEGEAPVNREADGVLSVAGVVKRFQRGTETVCALDGVDLSVRAGEFVALVGPSGSGKSTLLHLAGALDRPDAGSVRVGEQDLETLTAAGRAELRRRAIGFVFQAFHLLPELTALENVALPLVLNRDRSAPRQAAELLERVGLADRAGHRPGELSGGEMQRVAIARAVITRPVLLLADEPTGNLDSSTGADILDLLTSGTRDAGSALLLVTHDDAVAGRADRVLTLRDGRLG